MRTDYKVEYDGYRIVTADNYEDLMHQVTNLFKEGWQCHDGLFFHPVSQQICQVMVRPA